ncbi:MAG TPA: helix-turn-helix domain-containing protein [Burkholderiaceae bacterium]
MSDAGVPETSTVAQPHAATAGAMLRQARQAQGLHIAALAAAIKVVPRKLELLESDRIDQLLDATFTRALAQTVCRTLKIDPAPILALLPPLNGHRLEQVAEGLNTPFRERPGRFVPKEWASMTSPALWLAALLVVAAAAMYTMPAGWLPFQKSVKSTATGSAAEPAGPVTATIETVPASVPEPAASAGAVSTTQEATPPAAQPTAAPVAGEPAATAPATGVLQVRTTAQSWIDVTDARGQSLISRMVQPGEQVDLDGVMPLKLRIGNAGGTQLMFRGQPVALAGFTRNNVAQLELK